MLETSSDNANPIQSLNLTIIEFMQTIGMGSMQSKGHQGGEGLIITQLVQNRKLPPLINKTLELEFGASLPLEGGIG
jgi:hypothetical protein